MSYIEVQQSIEKRIKERLQLALSFAESGDFEKCWEITEGLWSLYMARDRQLEPSFPGKEYI